MGDSKRLEVFTVVKREGQEKGWFVKIGSAFVNKDGSLNCFLDALPVNGTLHIREPFERDGDAPRGGGRDNDRGQSRDSGRRGGSGF